MLTSRNRHRLLSAACLVATFPVLVFGQNSVAVSPGEAAHLIAVLSSDASLFDKAKACQRLAVLGDQAAVPALAALLGHPKLSNYARCGLEAVPAKSAGDALRRSVNQLQGDQLVGVINSIGQRRDTQAVESLSRLLDHDHRTVAHAAARALGHIGNARAADILRERLSQAAANQRVALADACLVCAQRLLTQDDRQRALGLYATVGSGDVPEHLRMAATSGAILAQGKDGLPLLIEQLNSEDDARFRLALWAARRMDADVSAELVAQFAKQSPARQAMLLVALGDLGSNAALPVVLTAAKTGAPEVRIQAMRTLARLGDATVVPTLLDAATQADGDVAQAAWSALVICQSDQINADIVAMLDGHDKKNLHAAMDVAAKRHVASATPALLHLADSSDATIRLDAIRALGQTVQIDDLPKVLARAIALRESDEWEVVRDTLQVMCVRLPQDACAEQFAAAIESASTSVKALLLEQLSAVGGTRALETVLAAAYSEDDALQDAATRVLGTWMSADAAPAILRLANSLTNSRYEVRVLRGYIRLARQLEMPPRQRMEVCQNALAIAQRTEEKMLVLDVLRRYPSPEGMETAVSLLSDTDVKEPACGVAVSIAERVLPTYADGVEEAMRQVLGAVQNQEIKDRAKSIITSLSG